ncbi:putative rRNA-processing protein EBP2 homolog [Lycorma delicatula]|uniref:putative rRNA-processing protein EBP2 homolog n=1 Tax=Lycorma delicatula TaxID=130591 RepID=UPI003F516567
MVVHSDDDFVSSDDSDAELQELYAKGILKPGLNIRVDATQEKKKFVNNVQGLSAKLQEFKNDYKWTERLDLVTDAAPMAPEMALQLQEQEQRVELVGGGQSARGQLDEFKRESLFHRQAQAAVLEGLKRLKSMGVPTKRPDDYFAEMAKTDEHMQKVRTMLVKKQAETERIEKVRKIRQQKKFNKQMQAEMRLKKQNEKKQMMDEVKKFRKGIRKDLDFLEDKKGFSNKKPNKKANKSQLKRKYKDKKFGFGGKKRGLKRNTKESTSNVEGHHKPSNKKAAPNKRPGKNVRQKMKAKKRS